MKDWLGADLPSSKLVLQPCSLNIYRGYIALKSAHISRNRTILNRDSIIRLMSATPLRDLWEASASQPFEPIVGKKSQFAVGFTLILIGFVLTSLFGLSKH